MATAGDLCEDIFHFSLTQIRRPGTAADYILVCAEGEAGIEKVKYLPDIYIMGEIVHADDGIKLHSKGGHLHDIEAQGWVHFG